eukprot:4834560-Prymnesium_polylepis.1
MPMAATVRVKPESLQLFAVARCRLPRRLTLDEPPGASCHPRLAFRACRDRSAQVTARESVGQRTLTDFGKARKPRSHASADGRGAAAHKLQRHCRSWRFFRPGPASVGIEEQRVPQQPSLLKASQVPCAVVAIVVGWARLSKCLDPEVADEDANLPRPINVTVRGVLIFLLEQSLLPLPPRTHSGP